MSDGISTARVALRNLILPGFILLILMAIFGARFLNFPKKLAMALPLIPHMPLFTATTMAKI